MKIGTKGMIVAAAAAGLFLSRSAMAADEAKEAKPETTVKVKCYGVNTCAGHGACAGAGNACAGNNGCSGQGFVETTEKDCKDKGGRLS